MSLFLCVWPDNVSLLVDLPDEAAAIAAATEHASGVRPAACKPFDRLFAAEVFIDEDEDGQELLVVEPLEHVAEALLALEESAEDGSEVLELPIAEAPAMCGYECEDENTRAVFVCSRAPHPGDPHHRADDGAGGVIEWEDER